MRIVSVFSVRNAAAQQPWKHDEQDACGEAWCSGHEDAPRAGAVGSERSPGPFEAAVLALQMPVIDLLLDFVALVEQRTIDRRQAWR